ncbi:MULTISPECIES: hypothetical protein [Halobacterium]|uniref:hypothetical protein n=1 Tax=Halobacterium TaxID=2239 RepID=UPI000A78B02E|nr:MULTISPECIES: hypothetical protein [Halobacterium]MCG1003032.1 hypothetical protein [Halobacterium noricense]
MSLQDFINKSRKQYEKHGSQALPGIVCDFAVSAASKVPYISQFGTNVYSREWDVLIILDACRLDLYRSVVDSETDYIWSVGSSSEEWIQNTFENSDTSETAYITGNIFSRDYLSESDFHTLREVWKYGWDDDEGTIPPRPITDEAIRTWRKSNPQKMIIHYMQPHFPAIGSVLNLDSGVSVDGFGRGGKKVDIWSEMRSGAIDTNKAWQAYRENLEYVLEELDVIKENVDGKIAITADHGNSFGEWGSYGHPSGLQSPYLRRVPWDTYECQDKGTYYPEEQEREDTSEDTVEERLESLGYV